MEEVILKSKYFKVVIHFFITDMGLLRISISVCDYVFSFNLFLKRHKKLKRRKKMNS